jgi:putative ABC transport system permease protein
LASKNLWRRPARTVLTVLGLAVSIAAVVALVGLAESLENSFLDLYSRRGTDLVVQRRGGNVQLTKVLPLKLAERIRTVAGVREVVAGLADMIAFEKQNLYNVLINGWEPNSPVWDRVHLLSGEKLREGDEHQILLGRILAANLGKKVGDEITLYGHTFHVKGIFESFSVHENGAVFMLLADLEREIDRPGQVTGFAVHAIDRSPAAVQALARKIEALDPQISAKTSREFVESLSQMKLTRTMSWLMASIAIAIGAIGMLNTMAMSVFERRAEIAALRAIGWRQRRVVGLILREALIVAGFGALAGILVGVAAIQFLAHWRQTSGLVQGDISFRAIAEGLIIAALMAVLGAYLPARSAARRNIVASLHGS